MGQGLPPAPEALPSEVLKLMMAAGCWRADGAPCASEELTVLGPLVLGPRNSLLLGLCGRNRWKEENEEGKEHRVAVDGLYLFRIDLQMGFTASGKSEGPFLWSPPHLLTNGFSSTLSPADR